MTAKLDKSIKRELDIDGKAYTITISPDGVKVVEKGHRNGPDVSWRSIVSAASHEAGASSDSASGQ
jgi:hypothetical protein